MSSWSTDIQATFGEHSDLFFDPVQDADREVEDITFRYKPQDFQAAFFNSTVEFPCRVAPWGDGKTLTAIAKGVYLSLLYPGNEGLIMRLRHNALMRSIQNDFELVTGLRVPRSPPYVVELPGTGGSKIHFVHADTLEIFKHSIQGMNLGWAIMEQADDFEDTAVFDMLAGRVRKIVTPVLFIQKHLVRRRIIKRPVKNLRSLIDPLPKDEAKKLLAKIEQAIRDYGFPVRQTMIIANACGHNWVYKKWIDPKTRLTDGKRYSYSEGEPFENEKYVPESTRRIWEDMRRTAPKKYNRYVMNSHEAFDIEGAYYAELMSDAMEDDRLEREGLYDDTDLVYTFWDLGVSDDTAIWFAQFIGSEIHWVDYYANRGKGIKHYSDVLDEKGYKYGDHFLPHDAAARQQGAQITTRLDTLRKLRHGDCGTVRLVERHTVAERIEASRTAIKRSVFADKCGEGVECLIHYHREINKAKSTEEEQYFLAHPAHDKWSHGADSFGYGTIAWKYESIEGQVLGSTRAVPLYESDGYGGSHNDGSIDLLEVA